jgi:hypothetical protein
MYFTDRGIEELEARRGDEEVTVAWLAERLRDFVNLNPSFETAVDRLATFLARDDEEALLLITVCGSSALPRTPTAAAPLLLDCSRYILTSERCDISW